MCYSLLSVLVKIADARQMRPRRTADEDFGTLLEAAVFYDRRVAALLGENDSSLDTYPTSNPFPRLLIVVTGMISHRCAVAVYVDTVKLIP